MGARMKIDGCYIWKAIRALKRWFAGDPVDRVLRKNGFTEVKPGRWEKLEDRDHKRRSDAASGDH
jgi:hypothetical protein